VEERARAEPAGSIGRGLSGFTSKNMCASLLAILADGHARRQKQEGLQEVQQRLRDNEGGESPAMRAAREMLGTNNK
jgi:hypothetical protein